MFALDDHAGAIAVPRVFGYPFSQVHIRGFDLVTGPVGG